MTENREPARIIDGKAIAADLTEKVAVDAAAFEKAHERPPSLAVVLVGDNPASAVYVRNKGKTAERLGIRSIQKILPTETSQDELVAVVSDLNDDPSVHGILVQMPLPAHLDADAIIELIRPEKDVDGFHPINVGRIASGAFDNAMAPCTPAGCITLIKAALGDDLSGKHAVIIGRSNIVGKPAAQLLLAENCTVTIAHSRTRDLPEIARQADILVAAVGRPEMIKGDWLKPGCIAIDVGINRIDAPEKGDGKTKLVGDIDFDSAAAVAGAITPVPGGVGPMTIAMLMANTVKAAQRQAAT